MRGKTSWKEVKKEMDEGGRSRSGSLRRERGKEATVLAGEKQVDGERMN